MHTQTATAPAARLARNPRGNPESIGRATEARLASSRTHRVEMMARVRGTKAQGVTSWSALAAHLNLSGFRTVRGGWWSAQNLRHQYLRARDEGVQG